MKNKTRVFWVISICAYLFSLIILGITKDEKILIATETIMVICIIEELLFYHCDDMDENGSLYDLIMLPSFIPLLLLMLITIRIANYFNVIVSNAFGVSTICVALLFLVVRWIIHYRKEKIDIIMVVISLFIFVVYWEATAVTFHTLNCELDDSENKLISGKVIDKGYCDYGIRLPDPLKPLVVDVETEEYGQLRVDVTKEEYTSIRRNDLLHIHVAEGALGETYYYLSHKWMYPYTESTLFNKEYKVFLSHEKCFRE